MGVKGSFGQGDGTIEDDVSLPNVGKLGIRLGRIGSSGGERDVGFDVNRKTDDARYGGVDRASDVGTLDDVSAYLDTLRQGPKDTHRAAPPTRQQLPSSIWRTPARTVTVPAGTSS